MGFAARGVCAANLARWCCAVPGDVAAAIPPGVDGPAPCAPPNPAPSAAAPSTLECLHSACLLLSRNASSSTLRSPRHEQADGIRLVRPREDCARGTGCQDGPPSCGMMGVGECPFKPLCSHLLIVKVCTHSVVARRFATRSHRARASYFLTVRSSERSLQPHPFAERTHSTSRRISNSI